jgi:hypothetical protein
MKVKDLKELVDKMIKEGKGDYIVASYNGDYNYDDYKENAEAEVQIIDDLKYLDISVGNI